MPTSYRPLPVPSLIQGISQQSDQATGQSSARDQRNCVNDILLGARARNGSRVLGKWAGTKTDPFCHRIRRSAAEDYLVVVEDGILDIINMASGVKATITGSISSYLATSGIARQSYAAATVEDTTFLANLDVVPAMAATLSDARDNYALVHFKAASYLTTYKVHIVIGASTYTASYTTPDNSAAANAEFIATNRLAEEMADALVALVPTLTADGHTGFSISRRASTIRIFGGTSDFYVWSEDGLGGEQLVAFKDRIKALSDLPGTSRDGYLVAVAPEDATKSHDVWLEYQGDHQNGAWVEVVAPSTPTTINAATMPHLLINTGLNAFTVQPATWGTRLAGDGIETAKDPNFIGKRIVDLQFIDSRLAIIGEGWYSLSRSGNAFVYFPDTVQTSLVTAPIHYNINTGKVTLVRSSVVVGEALQFWSDGSQIRLSSGQENIREDTVENLPTTTYEYDGVVPPLAYGQRSLVFGTSRGRWNNFIEVLYDGPIPAGEININGHCPNLVKGGLRQVQAGDSMRMLSVLCDEEPLSVYTYQWYNNGSDRVQSAWNIWDFPAATRVLWTEAAGSKLYVLISWGASGHSLEVIETEYEGDEDEYIPLRADHRVDETYITGSGVGYKEVTLPYPVLVANRDAFKAYYRVDDPVTGEERGKLLSLEWQSDTVVRVKTTVASPRIWIGRTIKSYRTFPKPYMVGKNGEAILSDRLFIAHLKVSHTNATTYRVETELKGDAELKVSEFSARYVQNPLVINNKVPFEASGEFPVKIGYTSDEATITLVNDTIYPSSWESVRYEMGETLRTQ